MPRLARWRRGSAAALPRGCVAALAALLALVAAAAASPAGVRADASSSPVDGECVASTGRQAIESIASPKCSFLLLDGVVSVYDTDFSDAGKHDIVRMTNLTIRSAAAEPFGSGVGAARPGGLPRAALEATPLLSRHINVAKGATVTVEDVSIAGTANGGSASVQLFSVFDLAPGGSLSYVRCDLRARTWLCEPPPADEGGQRVAAPGGAVNATRLGEFTVGLDVRRVVGGDVVVAVGEIDASRFYGGPPSRIAITMINSTIWCAATAAERGGRSIAPGDDAARVAARVLTPGELAAALGATGSRTLLLSENVTLPRAGSAPRAMVQDRDVALRSVAGARVHVGVPPSRARECVQPAIVAGPGGSVAFSSLMLVAADPGCATEPAARCAVGGEQLPFPVRGSLLPAELASVSPGGWLIFDGVTLAYGACGPRFAGAAAFVATRAPPGAATLTRAPDGAVTLTCESCELNCSLSHAGVAVGEGAGALASLGGDRPAALSLRNTTITCGGGVEAAVAGAAGSSQRSRGNPTAALVATASIAAAAVAAAAAGAVLGARAVAHRRAVAAEGGEPPAPWAWWRRPRKAVGGGEDGDAPADPPADAGARV